METNQIISRKDAILSGRITYFTGVPCKRGHISPRQVSNRTCCDCTRATNLNYYANNCTEIKDKSKMWREENREHLREYRASNDSVGEWKLNHRDRVTEQHRIWSQKYRQARRQTYPMIGPPKRRGYDISKPGCLYFVLIRDGERSYVGFGITGHIHQRLYAHRRNAAKLGINVDVICSHGDGGERILNIETLIKRTVDVSTSGIKGFVRESFIPTADNMINLSKLLADLNLVHIEKELAAYLRSNGIN